MIEWLEGRRLLSGSASASASASVVGAAAGDATGRTVSISDASAAEFFVGEAQVVFTITVSVPVAEGESPHPTIRVTTQDGTAKAGEDYRPVDVVVPLFQFTNQAFVSTTVAVNVIGDFDEESAETFTVKLSDPVGDVSIADGEAGGTIQNTPPPLAPTPFGGTDGPLTFADPGHGGGSIDIRGPGSGLAFFVPEETAPRFIQLDGTTKATSLRITGDVELPDVRVNGPMKSFGAKNVDLAGVVTFNGDVPKITLDDVSDSRIELKGHGAVSLVADQVKGLRLNATGPVKSIRVGDWGPETGMTPVEDNLITTPALAAVSSNGGLAVAITADTIGRVSARGNLSGTLRAAESIGTVNAGSLAGAALFAGVSPDIVIHTLPDDASDFVNPSATIGPVTTHAKTSNVIAFIGSDIVAPTIGALKLGRAEKSTSADVIDGVAAHGVRSLSATTADDRVNLRNLDTPSDSRTFDEFVVRII
jgi:hypothetical protein